MRSEPGRAFIKAKPQTGMDEGKVDSQKKIDRSRLKNSK
jgi:hypothetical protein